MTAAFLQIARSVTGRRWVTQPGNERLALALSQSRNLPEIVGRVLAARGIGIDAVDGFLTPTLRHHLPDPSHLRDMDVAAERLAKAIRLGESVAVFADYDVDGATSAALLVRFFRAAGRDLRVYVPDRIDEGYGPNAEAFRNLAAEGIRLVVTVDCGITAFDALEAAGDAGLDVVVLDHHAAEPRLPRAIAVVNPNRLDQDTPHRHLCAAGVTFLTVIALNRTLRQAGWYQDRPEPDLLAWLDLVALGTICDVVPLTGLNRAFVAQGLKVMARRGNPGLAALADVAAVNEKPDAYHAGFVLGPRVNAGGRVGEAGLGARLLATDDLLEAGDLAQRLDLHNAERKAIESMVLESALASATIDASPELILVSGAGWHPGVIGIVAARLKERFHRPALVVALENGIGKASGRSIRGVDLGAAVIAARQAGLLINGGGHPMAAGFTVREELLPALRQFLEQRIADARTAPAGVPTLELDGMVSVGAATPALVSLLSRLAPFGTGNAEPRFAVADARIQRADVVGTSHVRCILSGVDGGRLKAIAFRAVDTDLGQALLTSKGRPLHLAGTLRIDRWNGAENAQLLIDDAAFPLMGSDGGSPP